MGRHTLTNRDIKAYSRYLLDGEHSPGTMEKYLRDAIPRKDIFVIPDVRANAIGYEVFANRILKERQKSAF